MHPYSSYDTHPRSTPPRSFSTTIRRHQGTRRLRRTRQNHDPITSLPKGIACKHPISIPLLSPIFFLRASPQQLPTTKDPTRKRSNSQVVLQLLVVTTEPQLHRFVTVLKKISSSVVHPVGAAQPGNSVCVSVMQGLGAIVSSNTETVYSRWRMPHICIYQCL